MLTPTPPPSSILVRGVNWLGDAVMTTPALFRLREKFPDTRLVLLTPHKLADLWRHHPCLDAVLTFSPAEGVWNVGRRLRHERFEWGLALPNSPRSALELFLAGIPRRIGYRRAWRRCLLNDLVAPRPQEVLMHKKSAGEVRRLAAGDPRRPPLLCPLEGHHIFHYLHLVAHVGASADPVAPSLHVTAEEQAAARTRFLPDPAPAAGWVGLNPGAEYGPAKRWPVRRFLETALAIHQQTRCGWILLGGPKDAPLNAEIRQGLLQNKVEPVVDLSGATSLRELCAVLSLCRVLITNDTGPMHVAAAVGTPVAAVFGSTSPALTRPGHPAHHAPHIFIEGPAPCAPCFLASCPIDHRCLTHLPASQVVEPVLRLLAESS